MHGLTFLALLVVIVASVSAQEGGYGHHHLEEYIDYRAKPKYHYDYAVHDGHTHDFKSQWEHRDGKETKGQYTLLQPDGRKRIVEYVAGKHGADYKIKYEGHGTGSGGIGSFGISV